MFYTGEIVKKAITDNKNKKDLFLDIYEALKNTDIPDFEVSKVGDVEVKFIFISKDNLEKSALTNVTSMGTSHSERYYFLEIDNELLIVSLETGGGYLNRGHNTYDVSLNVLYGNGNLLNKYEEIYTETTITPNNKKMSSWVSRQCKVKSMSDWHKKIKHLYGIGLPTNKNINTLKDKELISFLRSALTRNRFQKPVFLSNECKSFMTINSSNFISLFKDKFSSKIENFNDIYSTYQPKSSLIEDVINLLKNRFPDDITFDLEYDYIYIYADGYRSSTYYFKGEDYISKEKYIHSINKISLHNKLFEKIYKNDFDMLEYYFYYYDFNLEKINKISDYFKFSVVEEDTSILYSKHSLINSFHIKEIKNLEALIKSEYLEKQTIANIEKMMNKEISIINKTKEDFVNKERNKIIKYFEKKNINISIDYTSDDYDKDIELKITFLSMEEI